MKEIMGILFLIGFLSCNAQTELYFDVVEEKVEKVFLKSKKKEWKEKEVPFFEDNTYVVRKTCSGEWGGSIWFKNKKTGIEYSCAATCPVVINKHHGTYVVTSTLAHLSGFSEIIEIKDPKKMTVFKHPKKSEKIHYVGDFESKSTKGTKQLLDSIGVLTLVTFPYDEQLFHIVTDFNKTYLAKIQAGKFVTLQLIADESLWTYNPQVIKTKEDYSILFFKNDKAEGYLEIKENTIKVNKI